MKQRQMILSSFFSLWIKKRRETSYAQKPPYFMTIIDTYDKKKENKSCVN